MARRTPSPVRVQFGAVGSPDNPVGINARVVFLEMHNLHYVECPGKVSLRYVQCKHLSHKSYEGDYASIILFAARES